MALNTLIPPPSHVPLIEDANADSIWKNWLTSLYGYVRNNMTRDFYFDVAAGYVDGHTPVNRIAHDTAITTTLGTVGHQTGTLHVYSSTADIDTISSDNAGDTHDITLVGLDADYEIVTQTVTLQGQTPVALGTNLYRINCMDNDIGTTLTATLGTIYLYVSGGGQTAGVPTVTNDIRSTIRKTSGVSHERCENSVYTVPANKTAFVVFGKTTVTDGKALELTFWGGIGHVAMKEAHHIDIKDNNYDYFFKLPSRMPSGTDLEIRATVTSGTAEVAAAFDIILVDI